MRRDYKKEYEREKENKIVIKAKLNKELGQKFKLKLDNENKTISKWILENVKQYIDEY